MKPDNSTGLHCPVPISEYKNVLLAHGGGGRLMHELIEKVFLTAFGSPDPGERHDGAVIETGTDRVVLTTDSYVVDPLFFPGGNIGTLAVNGTVNDLAMCGARPLAMTAAFIIEEGFPVESLWKIALSMRGAADNAALRIVTGDTKVVDRGRGDGLFINTAGVGVLEHRLAVCPGSIIPGDQIILSGDIGRHGIAVMAQREGFDFETEIESDCAPLAGSVLRLIEAGVEIHCLRDLTRGGLATTLVEVASAARVHIKIDEKTIPVREEVRGACEILGLDPLYVANEGRFVAFVQERDCSTALKILASNSSSPSPVVIGNVAPADSGAVTLRSMIGAERCVEMLSGEQLPRIC